MKIFKKNIRFNWHRWPVSKNTYILSIYEFIMYICVFVGVVFVYWKLQYVPHHYDEIAVNLIRHNDSVVIKDYRVDKKLCIYLEYRFPASFTLENDYHGKLFFNIWMKPDSRYNFYYNNVSTKQADSLYSSHNYNIPPNIVSLVLKQDNTLFSQIFNDAKGNLYSEWISSTMKDSIAVFHRSYKQDSLMVTEDLFNIGEFVVGNIVDVQETGPLSRSRWYSLYDVSQSYFKIKLDGNFKEGTLKLDFVGVTDFSHMIPEPDEITMNSICFTDAEKIQKIRSNGLSFHATFKELENFQNARVFLVSALISALLAIFVTFIILALYKMFKIKEVEENEV